MNARQAKIVREGEGKETENVTRKVIMIAVAALMIGSSAARAHEGMANCKGSDTTECQAQKGQLCVTWMSALEDFIKRQNATHYRNYRDLLNWSSKSVTDWRRPRCNAVRLVEFFEDPAARCCGALGL